MIPGSCVPHTTCCDDGDGEDAGGVEGNGEDAGGGDGLIWLYAVNIPPTATMTAHNSSENTRQRRPEWFLIIISHCKFHYSYSDN